jgi:hypothetical protein
MADEIYSNIRKILGNAIGRTVIDITQHDADEFAEDQRCYIMLMFDDGNYLKFIIGDEGFCHSFEELE